MQKSTTNIETFEPQTNELDLLFDHLSDIIIDSFLNTRNTQYTDDKQAEVKTEKQCD